MGKNRLLTIFLVVFVDLLGFSLILPLLPYYAQEFGASDILIGVLVAAYALAQLVGAPLLGRLSDKYGRRPILLVSIFGTAVGFLLLAWAEPLGRALGTTFFGDNLAAINLMVLAVLFFSRVLDGLTGGNISVAQAYISDVTDVSNRAKGLGMIGAAFGLGFIIGPAVGGSLSTFGFGVPAYVAAALAILNLVAVYFFLPESLTAEKRAEIGALAQRTPVNFSSMMAAFTRPRVGPLLHVRFFFGLAFSMFQSIFALYASKDPLQLDAQQTAYVLTYVGLLSVVIQGFAIGRLTQRFSERQLMLVAAISQAIGLLAWGLAPNLWTLLLVLIPIAFGGGILNTVINSALSKSVYPEEIGGTLGLAASVESLTRVIAPIAGGLLLARFGALGPGIFCGLVMIWVSTFIWRRLISNPDPPLAPRGNPSGEFALQGAGD